MKKTVKIAAITLAALLVAAITAPMLLRGKIGDIVKREANAMLDARLDFERLNISLLRHFPNASLEIRGLTLVGTDRFEGDTIVAAERISVVVDLLSIVGDEGFVVRKVILAAPAVHARKLADGAVNWNVMKPSAEPAEEEPAEEGPSSFRLAIRDFRIAEAMIRYEDDSTAMRFSTGPLSLRLGGDMSADRADLDLELLARNLRLSQGGITLLNDAEAELDAVVGADMVENRYTLAHNTLRLNAIETTIDGWVELRDQAVAMDLTAGCEQVRFKELLSLVPAFYTRDFRNLTAGGELSLSLWARGELRGTTLPSFELRSVIRDGSFRYSSLPKAVTGIRMDLRVANPGGTMDRTEVDLKDFGLTMAGNSLTASLYATDIVNDPAFRIAAAGKVDLGAVKEVYPLEKGTELRGEITADVKAAARMSDIEKGRAERIDAAGNLVVEQTGITLSGLPPVEIRRAAASITPQAMTLGEFGITVGGSDLAATGQLTGYMGYLLRGSRLTGRLYVKSELLDLNELLAAAGTEETQPGETAAKDDAGTTAPTIPDNLDLRLKSDLKRILLQKMTITDLTGEIRVADGTLSLDGLSLGIFEGRATASGRYAATDPARPELAIKASLSGASFEKSFEELEMVRQLVPLFAKTGGNYSLSLDMRTALDAALSPDLNSIDATGELRSADIHVQNIEAFDALAKALNNESLRRIEASDVAIRFAVKQGRITTQPFDLKLGGAAVTLSGSTGLDQSIDYTARVALPAAKTGGVLEHVNVKIGGTFTAPRITLGVKEAAQEAVKNLVDEQVQRLTGSESLSEEVARQAERLREEARKAGDKLVAAAEAQREKLVEGASSKGRLAKAAAEKAGDKLVEEARKQADKLLAEAEAQVARLTAEKNPEQENR